MSDSAEMNKNERVLSLKVNPINFLSYYQVFGDLSGDFGVICQHCCAIDNENVKNLQVKHSNRLCTSPHHHHKMLFISSVQVYPGVPSCCFGEGGGVV